MPDTGSIGPNDFTFRAGDHAIETLTTSSEDPIDG